MPGVWMDSVASARDFCLDELGAGVTSNRLGVSFPFTASSTLTSDALQSEAGIDPAPRDRPAISVAGSHFRVLIVGAGISGITTAIELLDKGLVSRDLSDRTNSPPAAPRPRSTVRRRSHRAHGPAQLHMGCCCSNKEAVSVARGTGTGTPPNQHVNVCRPNLCHHFAAAYLEAHALDAASARYPGAACDVPSYAYLPYLYESSSAGGRIPAKKWGCIFFLWMHPPDRLPVAFRWRSSPLPLSCSLVVGLSRRTR